MHSRIIVASLMLAIASPLHAQSADTVNLRFDWPVGMTARVEADWSRVQVNGQQRDSSHFRSNYRLRVAEHPAGRLIATDSFEVRPLTVTRNGQPITAPSDSSSLQVREFLERIGSFMPSYVVSDSGDFVSVADIERVRGALNEFLEPLLAQLGDAAAAVRPFFINLTSTDALTATAAQEWNLIAGTWVGAEWEVGARYEAMAREPIAAFPGHEVDMQYEFSAVERVPCTEQDQGRSCILLEMLSEPDPASMQLVMREFMSTIPGNLERVPALESMRVVNEVTVIADPRTLRPYLVEHVKHIDMSMTSADADADFRSVRVDTRSARYRY